MLTTSQSYATYQGNGAATQFPFNFIVQAAGQLVVTITNNNVSPPVTTVLASSQYTVTGIGSGNEFAGGSGPGGTVTYPVAGNPLPTGWSITIQRIVPLNQGTSLTNQGAFYPQVVEAALDYLTMMVQQLAAQMTGAAPVVVAGDASAGNFPPQYISLQGDDGKIYQVSIQGGQVTSTEMT